MHKADILITALVTAILSSIAGPSMAESPGPSTGSGQNSLAEIETRRAKLAEEIASANAISPSQLGSVVELLEQLDHVYEEHAALLGQSGEVEKSSSAADGQATGPHYSLAAIDRTADARDAARSSANRADEALTTARSRLEAARDRQEKAEKTRRLAKDQQRKPVQHDPPAIRVAELESRLASAQLELRRSEVAHWEAKQAATAAEVTRLQAELDHQREAASTDRIDLVDVLSTVDKRLFDLERVIATERFALEAAERNLARVQKLVEQSPTAEGRAKLEVERFSFTAHQRIASLRGEQRARLESSKESWQRRYQLLAGDSTKEERTRWWQEARESLEELDRQTRLKQARLTELEDESRTLRGRTSQGDTALAVRLTAVGGLISAYRQELAGLEDHRRLHSRLLAEIDMKEKRFQVADRITELRDAASGLWTYEIWTSEDRPITFGKIISALLVLTMGLAISRTMARLLGERVFPKLGYDEGAAHAFQSLALYALFVAVVLVSLRIVNIPLTAFAVVGGALAIGVGFGSQNIVNNFISGVILLAERPIKLGDLLQVGDIYGQVERIGLRSTRVRTGDNVHVILPNSSILENQVTNWSHNDPKVRVRLTVGVVYGSPTREVDRLIRKALAEHPRVLKDIDPEILFIEFGDNALIFEARFWIIMRRLMDRLKVESELRYSIDDLFRDAGLVIAFPQRDVHIDSAAPIQIEMVAPTPKNLEKET